MMQQRRVVVTAEADRDLVAIFEYVARDSPHQARLLLQRIRTAVDDLRGGALRYPVILERGGEGIRRRVVGSYNILFWVTESAVEVVHVVHGKRSLERLLFPEA